jgi:ribosome-associated protein YbcJ (S4-like RNA binding protein)/anti-sigma regulatory factor (Ser/Thr protein kinase)
MLGLARRFAAAEAGRTGFGEDRVADVEMVVNELVTNSVEHGGGTGILRIWIEDAHLVVEVRDVGQLHDPLVGRRPLRPLQARGRGLFLVNQFADLVRLHTGPDGTTVRAYFRTSGHRADGVAKRVVRHDGCVPRSPILDVPIAEDPIRLGQFLKLAGLAEHGGHAKALLEAEEVLVNGRVETRRGAQLRAGDVVAIGHRRARPVPLV